MSKLLCWVLGSACLGFTVVKLIGGLWCLLEFQRKWRPVPELWSIDWLGIVYRLEREFGVTITAADFAGLSAEARVALTAGELWELVTAKMTAGNADLAAEGWERLVTILAEALNVPPRRIAPGSRLYADLGMMQGLE
jgi:hypothetical protein